MLTRPYKALKLVARKVNLFHSTLWTRCVFALNGIRFGKGLTAYGVPCVNVSLGGSATIGERFTIRTGCCCTEVGSVGSRILVGRHGTLAIGNRVGMSNATLVCDQSVTIGDDVLIGGGAQIFDTNFHATEASARCAGKEDKSLVSTAPVHIGNRAFIGANVLICKGVSIGDEAMVAAGSVVVHDIPPGETWGGNPARPLRASRIPE